jgi:hypothetical protein
MTAIVPQSLHRAREERQTALVTATTNFLGGGTITAIVILSLVTPVLVAVLVLVLVRLMMKRAGTGLPQALGSAIGGGMAQPTRGTMHVVGCSAIERHAMIAPCTIAYAIEAPGMPAFSGQGTFYAQTQRWPQPGTNLSVVFDAANPAHVDIDWEHAPRPIDMAAGAAQALAEQLNQRGTTPPPAG